MSALTPLWPAGHLPLKGGDWPSPGVSQIFSAAGDGGTFELPIFPLEGEMSGRTEGGVQAPTGR
ncbi:lytic murein transglycosylase [Mesorhizobium sp. B2-4-11]|nr:lytic murein transglycosylase [Mesorhizobium sp. B2-4-11]